MENHNLTPEEFLAHHGVKGQKWGVVNNDPLVGRTKAKPESIVKKNTGTVTPGSTKKAKPADVVKSQVKAAKAKARVESYAKKAEVYKERSAKAEGIKQDLEKLGFESPRMRELYGKAAEQSDRMFLFSFGYTKATAVKKELAVQTKAKNIADKDAIAKAKGGLSRNQKLAVGGAAAGVILVGLYAHAMYPDIVTRNALPGQNISVGNFLRRYSVRVEKFAGKPITKSAFDLFDDTDVRVPAGTVFQRLTAYKDEDLGKNLYTTFTSADNDKYQGIYGATLRFRTGVRNLYISKMEMGEEIISPSQKKRVQIFADLLEENAALPGTRTTAKSYAADALGALTDRPLHGKMSGETLALNTYNNFATSLATDTPLRTMYYDRLKKAGYNALVDDNDAGKLSDVPMILLDAKKTVKNRQFVPLTKSMESEAAKRLVELFGDSPVAMATV